MTFFFHLLNLFFNWSKIALQNCVGFCQTSTWVANGNLLYDSGYSNHGSLTTCRVGWGGRWEGGSRGRGHRRTFCRFFSCINLDTLWAVHVFQFREVFLNCFFNEFLPPVLCHLSCKTDLWADSLWFWIFSSPSAIFCCCCCCCCYFEGSFPFLSLRPSFLWMPSLLTILFLFLNVVS